MTPEKNAEPDSIVDFSWGFVPPETVCTLTNGGKLEQNSKTPSGFECLNTVQIANGTFSIFRAKDGRHLFTYTPNGSKTTVDCKMYSMLEGVPKTVTCGNKSFTVTFNKGGEVNIVPVVSAQDKAAAAKPEVAKSPAQAIQDKSQALVKAPAQNPNQVPKAETRPPEPAPVSIVLPTEIKTPLEIAGILAALGMLVYSYIKINGDNWQKRHPEKSKSSAKPKH